MISGDYCLTMARYNAWQNKQMKEALETLPPEALTQERGAFFGSILSTINHIMWGDLLWMSRLDQGDGPRVEPKDNTKLTPTLAAWSAERFRTDGRILRWAERVRSVDLLGEMRWYSSMVDANMSESTAQCIVHLFNHQTHHRGQVHAMATAAGATGWTTDLILMPKQGPWL